MFLWLSFSFPTSSMGWIVPRTLESMRHRKRLDRVGDANLSLEIVGGLFRAAGVKSDLG